MTEHTRTTTLVTGANKGIGYEIARGLGLAGATAIVGARDPARGRAATEKLRAEGIDAHDVTLDVTDHRTIATAAAWIGERFGRLDVLVNNAGVALEWQHTPTELPLEVLRATYETNVFGVVAVTNAVLPLLRRSAAPRIVMLSTTLASLTLTADPDSVYGQLRALAYNSSKTALNAITVQYANELRGVGIKVNAANPGYCATDLNQFQGVLTAEQGAAVAVRLALLPDDGPTGTFVGGDGPMPW